MSVSHQFFVTTTSASARTCSTFDVTPPSSTLKPSTVAASQSPRNCWQIELFVLLAELRGREQDVELHYRLPDPWKRMLFVALCRRYGLKFREPGRRHTTVQLRAPKEFHDTTLWPEYLALSEELNAHLHDLTTRVIREAIDDDVSEPTEQASTKALPEANGG